MSAIIVGIDTSRVYNRYGFIEIITINLAFRKQPPGGQCTDLFGGAPEGASKKKPERWKIDQPFFLMII